MTTHGPSLPRVIIPLGVHQIFAWGTSFYLLTVLAQPIAHDTGWPPAWITAGFSAALLSSGLVSPRVGRGVVRLGGTRVLATGSAFMAAGLCGLALAPSLPFYLLAWLVLGAGMGASLYDAAFATLGTFYGAGARKSITTLTLFGGFASAICWPLSAFLVEVFGWRMTCGVYALFHLVVSIPMLLIALPYGPQPPPPRDDDPHGLSPAVNAARMDFLLLTTVFVSGSAIFSTLSLHLLTFLQALGFGLVVAVGLSSLIGPSQVGARVIEIAFGGRYSPLWTLLTATILIASGLSFLPTGFILAAACLMLYGAGNGVWSIARGTVPLALFGATDYPAVIARLAKAAFLSQAVAPLAGAFAISAAGPRAVLFALAGLAALNVVLVGLLIRRHRRA